MCHKSSIIGQLLRVLNIAAPWSLQETNCPELSHVIVDLTLKKTVSVSQNYKSNI